MGCLTMKKFISIIAVIAACTALTACGKTTDSSDASSASQNMYEFSEMKLTRAGITDRIVFTTLDELENFSNIAVVGKFIDDAEQEVEYEYSPAFEKDIITGVTSTNTIEVTKVLMGDVKVGDKLSIDQRYAVVDDELITFSELTPMQNGDEWVFFLRKRTNSDHYICSADSDSRFPTKNSASNNKAMILAESAELGVYNETDFNRDIYNEIVAKYDI